MEGAWERFSSLLVFNQRLFSLLPLANSTIVLSPDHTLSQGKGSGEY